MITAFLGILVNIVMGFTLNQGGHKHFHSHLMGGSCSHDHGSSNSGPAHGDYELLDLEVKAKPVVLRSRSLEIKCERNFEHNQHHHHHQRAENVDCCDLENCADPVPKKPAFSPITTTLDASSLKKDGGHVHEHGPGGCTGHHDEEDHKHDDHDHDHNHDHDHATGACSGHDHKHDHSNGASKEQAPKLEQKVDSKVEHKHDGKCDHKHDHAQELKVDPKPEHKHDGKCDHNHGPKVELKQEHKHDGKCDHKHDQKDGHKHDKKDDHKGHKHEHDGHDDCHGHNHFHDHDQGSNYSLDGMNVNLRAAFIHIVGDLVQSVGVFIVAFVIWLRPEWMWFDPLCTVLFSIIVVFTTVPVSKECVRVLMEATPVKLDVPHLKAQIETVPGVVGIFEIRIWMINESRTALSAKVLVDRYSSKTVSQIKTVCADYRIFNSTIELKVVDAK
jgi:Co/Zn/Cd efflux system component